MRLGKWIHGLGAIGVEVLAVLVLGWVLSVVHPSQDVDLSTRAQLTDQSAALDSAGIVTGRERRADREAYVKDRLYRSAEGLFKQIASHVNSLFTIGDET